MTMLAIGLAIAAGWLAVEPWRDDRLSRLTSAQVPARLDVRQLRERLTVGPARRRRAARQRVRVLQALSALAAELDAGQPPSQAIVTAAGDPPAWPSARAAAQTGGDVAAALAVDGRLEVTLLHLSACWRVSEESGAGLSRSVSTLTASARAAEDVRVQLEAELAGPRATARTLALLPLAGLAFGVLLGGDPLGWLLGTGAGNACLIGGLLLTGLGMAWTGRIAKAVERRL